MTDSTTIPETIIRQMVAHYLDTWNATEAGARAELLERHWATDCVYVDPLVEVRGLDAMGATIGDVQEQFPGCVFSQIGDVDTHHLQCRFQWGLGPAGEEPVVIGFDVLVLDHDHRVQDVRGFLDKVPA